MNTQKLFELADAAKNCGEYVLANQIFAVLAHAAITGAPGENDVFIGYEQDPSRDDIVENLADPNWAGYYDLPFVFDNNNNYLCIPLPLVSRHFCNHIVWRCVAWCDREQCDHSRNHWRLGNHAQAAKRDLWRRFAELADAHTVAAAVRVILAPPEIEEAAPVVMDEQMQWLGPATLAKLNMAMPEFEEFEEELA